MAQGLVLEGMSAQEHSRYYWHTDLEASFIGVTSIQEFDQICRTQFSPFYSTGKTARIHAGNYFAATGPALVVKDAFVSGEGYPEFHFPKEYPPPTRAVVSIYNPATPKNKSSHFSIRVNNANVLWWRNTATSYGERSVWCNTPDTYEQVNLGTLQNAQVTTVPVYFAPVLEYLGLTGENYTGCVFDVISLYNYPAGTGYAAGTYPAEYYNRLNALSFHWDH